MKILNFLMIKWTDTFDLHEQYIGNAAGLFVKQIAAHWVILQFVISDFLELVFDVCKCTMYRFSIKFPFSFYKGTWWYAAASLLFFYTFGMEWVRCCMSWRPCGRMSEFHDKILFDCIDMFYLLYQELSSHNTCEDEFNYIWMNTLYLCRSIKKGYHVTSIINIYITLCDLIILMCGFV